MKAADCQWKLPNETKAAKLICISVDLNESSLSALNLHEIFPVEDYVYSGYDFWYAKLNLHNQKLADPSILPVYYKDLA